MKLVLTTLLFCGLTCGLRAETLDRMEEITSRARNLEQFLNTPNLTQEYGKALEAYLGRNRFNCESYEAILDELREIVKKVPAVGERLWQKTSDSGADAFIARVVTGEKEDLADSEEVLRRVPRPFHGIWNDPAGGACQAHVCRPEDGLAPERWVIALSGAELFYLERRDQYAGSSILIFPVRKERQELRRVVLTGAPLLRDVHDFQVGNDPAVTTSLLQLWMRWAQARSSSPLVLLEENESSTPQFVDGVSTGKLRHWGSVWDFLPADSLARELSRSFTRPCFADGDDEGRDLVIGNLARPGAARTNYFAVSAPAAAQQAALRRLLLSFNYPNQMGQVGKLAKSDPKTLELMLTMGLKSPDETTRLKSLLAIHALRSVDVPGFRISSPDIWPGVPVLSGSHWDLPLENALGDSSAAVRGLAALALSDRHGGQGRPDLTEAMSQALSPENESHLWPSSGQGTFAKFPPHGRTPSSGQPVAEQDPPVRTYQGGSVTGSGTGFGQPSTGEGAGAGVGSGASHGPGTGAGAGAGPGREPDPNPNPTPGTGTGSGNPYTGTGHGAATGPGEGSVGQGGGTNPTPTPPPAPTRTPFDVIDDLARGVIGRGGSIAEDQLNRVISQVAKMPDAGERASAEEKLAQVMMANPDYRASTRALVSGLENYPDTLGKLRTAVQGEDCKSANQAFKGAGEVAPPPPDDH